VPAPVALASLLFWRPPCVLRTVVVNLKSDPEIALRGVLWRYRGAWLVLRDASILRAAAGASPVDGDVVVHRSNVAYMQAL
jgi:hypothetical protein